MGKTLRFPKPKIKLTEEETKEYHQIKNEIEEMKGLRDLFHCRRKVKEFLKKEEEKDREGH